MSIDRTNRRVPDGEAALKTKIMSGLAVAGLMTALAGAPAAQVPQFMHFQGVMTDDEGLPVNDTLSMQFRIYADTLAGSIWSDVQPDVEVVNGFYDVYLDVSALPFDVPYFLGIIVDLEWLGPKRPMAGVPYSFRSAMTKVVPGDGLTGASDSMAVQLSIADGGVTTAKLDDGSVTTDKILNDAVTGIKIADSSVSVSHIIDGSVNQSKVTEGDFVYSVNGIAESVTLQEGSNISIVEAGDTITISATVEGEAADDDWEVEGNDMYSIVSGDVGIGTSSPARKLHVVGDVRIDSQLVSTIPNGTPPFFISSKTEVDNLNADFVDGRDADEFADATHEHEGEEITSGTVPFAQLPSGTGGSEVAIGNHSHAVADDEDWVKSGNDLYYSDGSIGIGTASPTKDLDVDGAVLVRNALHVGTDVNTNNDTIFMDGANERLVWDNSQTRFELSDELVIDGVLAVGTTNLTDDLLGYNYFSISAPSPSSGEMGSPGDLYVGADLEVDDDIFVGDRLFVGSDTGSDDDAIQFDEPADPESLYWLDSLEHFKFTDSLAVTGPIFAGGDSRSYADTGGYNAFLSTGIPLSPKTVAGGPGSGDMGNTGDLFLEFDLEAGGDIYYRGNLSDMLPSPLMSKRVNQQKLTSFQAREVVDRLNPIVFRYLDDEVEEPGVERTKIGFDLAELPDLLKTTNQKGYKPMDLVAVLSMLVKEQQVTIEALEARVTALEEGE